MGQEKQYSEWYFDNTIDYNYEIEYTNSKGEKTTRYRSYRIPSPTLYPSNIKLTPAEQEYYNDYIALKKQLDFLLPPQKTRPFMAVQKLIENAAETIQNNKVDNMTMAKNLFENSVNIIKINENDEMSYQGENKSKWAFKLNLRKDKSDTPTKVLTNFDNSFKNSPSFNSFCSFFMLYSPLDFLFLHL